LPPLSIPCTITVVLVNALLPSLYICYNDSCLGDVLVVQRTKWSLGLTFDFLQFLNKYNTFCLLTSRNGHLVNMVTSVSIGIVKDCNGYIYTHDRKKQNSHAYFLTFCCFLMHFLWIFNSFIWNDLWYSIKCFVSIVQSLNMLVQSSTLR
jgi:hypothetical protein